jgi:hypothetical protein
MRQLTKQQDPMRVPRFAYGAAFTRSHTFILAPIHATAYERRRREAPPMQRKEMPRPTHRAARHVRSGNPSSATVPPKIAYWHVWTGDDGVTHQSRCELSAFRKESMGGRAAPQWNDTLLRSSAKILLCVQPVGWVGEWHENPRPQWIIPLSGRWFVETTDGMRVEMGPGDLSFGGDQNSTPDALGRIGHRSGTVGDEPASLMVIQLDDDAWRGARPGAFE